MIKVIEPGDKTMMVRCRACGCLFEFEENDLEWLDDDEMVKAVHCPTCNQIMSGRTWQDICEYYYDERREAAIRAMRNGRL